MFLGFNLAVAFFPVLAWLLYDYGAPQILGFMAVAFC
jgi:hypothetical protein